MTCPRRVVPGTTYLLTRRCVQRRYTLVPRGVVPKHLGYCVALAAERHGVEVHAVTCMSIHRHAVVTDVDGTIFEFCRDVHSLSARALNAHLGRWEALWSSQRLSLVELIAAPDVWRVPTEAVQEQLNPHWWVLAEGRLQSGDDEVRVVRAALCSSPEVRANDFRPFHDPGSGSSRSNSSRAGFIHMTLDFLPFRKAKNGSF